MGEGARVGPVRRKEGAPVGVMVGRKDGAPVGVTVGSIIRVIVMSPVAETTRVNVDQLER